MAIHFDVGGKPNIEFTLPAVRASPGGGGGGNVSSAQINMIVVLDRVEYDALPTKDAKTVYLIRG